MSAIEKFLEFLIQDAKIENELTIIAEANYKIIKLQQKQHEKDLKNWKEWF